MTSSRYEAHVNHANRNQIVLVDRVGDNSQVFTFTDEGGDAFVTSLSNFLAAGVERYGSVDEFTRALRWYNELKAAS